MRKIIEFFTLHRVWTNVLMFGVIGFGALFYSNMRYSFFPETRPDFITIQVAYPGAAPEEMEEGVVLKIEENLEGLAGVDRVTSVARENFATVTVEVLPEANLDKVLMDVKNAVDRINSFPQDAEKPIIFEPRLRNRTLEVVLYGETDRYNLKYLAEGLRDRLIAEDEISLVEIEGLPNLEFSVEVSERDLLRYGMTFEQIAAKLAAENVNISGGKFDTRDEEVLIRAYGRNYFAKELNDIVLRGQEGGTVVRLTDVANIREQWEDVPDKSYYNGKPAVVLNIDKTESEDILVVAKQAKAIIDDFNARNKGVHAYVLDDQTVPLIQRLSLLINNGLMGLILVIITLGFFLNLRMSFWVSVGIPFSFAGMFIVAGMWGITINVISLFGMIIVVGILVDDAIVVGENIYAHYEKGVPSIKAAIDGAVEMIGPVFASVMTTILAFLPFFFLDGFLGKFIWHMALVVIASLVFSLIEAFLILPSHLAHSKGLHPHAADSKTRKRIENFIDWLTYKVYAPSLRLALAHKWIAVVTPVALVLMTIGLIGGGLIGVTFFPFIDGDTLPVNVTLVSGRQEADTDSLLSRIEQNSWALNEKLKSEREDGKNVIIGIKRDIGTNDFGESGSHTGKLTLQLLEGEERIMDSYLISQRLRELTGPVPEAEKLAYGRISFFGKPVSVSLLGNNLDQLNRARDLLVVELKNFTTLKDVTDSNQEGRRELDLKLKPQAHALGLTLQDVAGQVRSGFFGKEVQRIQRGRDEIRVWVRYAEEDRAALGFLDRMRIRTPGGAEYQFSELATYSIERGLTSINHLEKQREIKVEASLADEGLDLPPILEEVRTKVVPPILAKVQGVRASFEGQSRNQDKTMSSMRRAFAIALIAMFILVVLVFRSYAQAGLIFSLIPIGILGAVWGHGILGIQLNTLSLYGIIALSGIVINDSIVLIDQVNRKLRQGADVHTAVYEGAISRLRPIILTTVTTAAGLAPIIMETSRQAQFLIPMAVSVAFGLLFGTFILLIILPAAFLAMNRIRVMWFTAFRKYRPSNESVEPAVIELQRLEARA